MRSSNASPVPVLPEDLRQVRIRNLRVGSDCADLAFERYAETVAADILRPTGEIEMVSYR